MLGGREGPRKDPGVLGLSPPPRPPASNSLENRYNFLGNRSIFCSNEVTLGELLMAPGYIYPLSVFPPPAPHSLLGRHRALS